MNNFASDIDKLLAERRPDRYEVDGGDGWLDEIADLIAMDIGVAEARFAAASAIVRRREGEKLKAANRLLREIRESGQFPLDWFETMHLPLSVGKERVAIRAMQAGDFVEFANTERRRAANDFSIRNESCEAAEWLADQITRQGVTYARELSLS